MEQRTNLRFRAQFRSSFSSVALVGGEGILLDLSVRGCRIESPIDVKPGSALEVRIEICEREPPIQIQAAVVRWCQEQQFGLEFEVIAPSEWSHLQHVVKQIEREPYRQELQPADVPGSV